jgi:hypothetical protein
MSSRLLVLICTLPALLLIGAISGTLFEVADYVIARSVDGILEHLGSVPAHWGATHLTALLLIAAALAAPKMAFIGLKTVQTFRQIERQMWADEPVPGPRPQI